MKYMIYESIVDFENKNIEITASRVCGSAIKYADAQSCKHPTLDKWAMPVLNYSEQFFNQDDLVDTLSSDWVPQPNKP